MDTRLALVVVGLFFFGTGIVLLIWWSGPIRLIFLNPDIIQQHDFTGEIITLTLPPMLAAGFGALMYLFHNYSPGRERWTLIAWAMLICGVFSTVLQTIYPIYITSISGYVLQLFPGVVMLIFGFIILYLQPFVIQDSFGDA